ncbi:MAG TPA: class F sortase [Verrucomicrobiae bacterium]|nr:class F sortase [Verrucomicrobiae bacterium]
MPFPKIGVPVRIQIPAIKVDATMQTVGLTKAGDMDVPANIAHVGWYKLSARPGELGTAVLGGHLNGKQGQAGVFIALNAMKAGDTLLVTDDGGLTRTFKVQKVRDYNYDDHPKEVFNSGPGSHMNLITCTGSWDTEIQKFSKRRVVFTTLVE